MSNVQKPNKIAVVWLSANSPDAHALLKAVAMMFNRHVPLSTAADLTERDEELLCERSPKS
jgi:hypothetical protein